MPQITRLGETYRGVAFICFNMDIFLLLFYLSTPVQASVYWGYIPNPPLLHPATWDERRIPVYVNDTKILGLPSSNHILHVTAPSFDYTGLTMSMPLCFTTNHTLTHCTKVHRIENADSESKTLGVHWYVNMLYLNHTNSTLGSYETPMLVEPCEDFNTKRNSRVALQWHTCHANHSYCFDGICDWTELNNTT